MNGCWQIAGWEIELSYQDYSHNVGIEDPRCSMPLDLSVALLIFQIIQMLALGQGDLYPARSRRDFLREPWL
jgi:hypothetical protein